jgi:Trm5-related predicted tRNA methylase
MFSQVIEAKIKPFNKRTLTKQIAKSLKLLRIRLSEFKLNIVHTRTKVIIQLVFFVYMIFLYIFNFLAFERVNNRI